MNFSDAFFLLWIIPAILVAIFYAKNKIGKDPVFKFSSLELLAQTGAMRLSMDRILVSLLRLASIFFLLLALMRPQTSSGTEKSTREIIDLMIVLDVSQSMASLDFSPDDRLTAAKREAERFIQNRPHDRIGLVIFSGESYTQCPLTTDHQAILSLLRSIRFGELDSGTAIGLGLANGVNRLKISDAKSKVIVLLTDGVNNAGSVHPKTAARIAKQYGIQVYTVGVGKEGTYPIPVHHPQLGTKLIPQKTNIDEATLKEIASLTGGRYFRAQSSDSLREVFKSIDQLEKTVVTVEEFTVFEEHYFQWLWVSLFILILEIIYRNLFRVKVP